MYNRAMGIFRKFIEEHAGEAVINPVLDGTLNPDVSAEIERRLAFEAEQSAQIPTRHMSTIRHNVENVMGSIAFGQ